MLNGDENRLWKRQLCSLFDIMKRSKVPVMIFSSLIYDHKMIFFKVILEGEPLLFLFLLGPIYESFGNLDKISRSRFDDWQYVILKVQSQCFLSGGGATEVNVKWVHVADLGLHSYSKIFIMTNMKTNRDRKETHVITDKSWLTFN